MNQMIVLAIALFLFFAAPALSAECSDRWSPHVVWQAAKIGKLTSELQLGPNGLFYAPSGNKLVVLDENGRKLWEAAGPGGSKSGRPVFDPYGSIFMPGDALIQEIKLNGSMGWNFKVYQGKSKSAVHLTTGPKDLLYLCMPSALYAIDTEGHYKWMVMQWGQGNTGSTQLETDWEILASAGNDQAVFVVLGKKKEGFSLIALSGEGKIFWRYSLGDIKGANLVTGKDGLIYATVNPQKIDRLNKGMVYAFGSKGDGKPRWSYQVAFDGLTAPTISEHGLLYFSAGGRLYALNQDDGTEVWHQNINEAISRPSVDENSKRVYVGTEDKRLLAVTPLGRFDWDFSLDGKVSMQPLAGPGGYLYVTTDAGSIYKIKDEPPVSDGG
ncbi:PQQ-binding-like beta-propeller repeat protein [Pelotomaculum sp. PtaB.Bin117]|uniref:outer membrane protein assembly factor BamB family protein n=1 Tax=Pelotomaculum sp. PtaB.Bin117 TaxID=1811694 RepID=UPI0009CF8A5C|nr:PQQ-binding-like beta-propeller repeat protein [Pelotomaculum sp. PtaB.Bin117]OPX89538.1 MAG: outer membrane biogenesis protein BamB [Pelotomaculum sp. PtaB.Bin117]